MHVLHFYLLSLAVILFEYHGSVLVFHALVSCICNLFFDLQYTAVTWMTSQKLDGRNLCSSASSTRRTQTHARQFANHLPTPAS